MSDELAEARETIRRLNRRCQEAESALKAKLDSPLVEGRTFGRVCANAAASMYKREGEVLRAGIAAAVSTLSNSVSPVASRVAGELQALLETGPESAPTNEVGEVARRTYR